MRAKEFTSEAEGTFFHGTRSDFDFSQLTSGRGLKTFDRILGPHFSREPEIASRFALYDPQLTSRQQKTLSGARIFPVHIPGKIYVLPQKRTMADMAAVALDAFMKVILPNKELLNRYIDIAVTSDMKRLSNINGRYSEKPDLEAIERLKDHFTHYLTSKKYHYLSAPMFKIGFSDEAFLKDIAEQYKQLLLSQGYGLIQYRNTNPKETGGIEDKNSYIALTKPKSIFDKDGELKEGWRDWVAGAAIGTSALGGAIHGYNALTSPVEPQQIEQPAAPKELPVKNMNALERGLANFAQKSGIVGDELKQFLAQCAHETMNFSTLEELGSDKYIARKYDRKYNPSKAKVLGNTKVGDGVRYKGRGFIQLTGKYNYSKVGEALNLPLLQQPQLAERPDIAAKVAVWFWQNRVKPKVSDFTDVKQSTRPINPALKGLPSRQDKYDKYTQVSIPTPPPTGQRI